MIHQDVVLTDSPQTRAGRLAPHRKCCVSHVSGDVWRHVCRVRQHVRPGQVSSSLSHLSSGPADVWQRGIAPLVIPGHVSPGHHTQPEPRPCLETAFNQHSSEEKPFQYIHTEHTQSVKWTVSWDCCREIERESHQQPDECLMRG